MRYRDQSRRLKVDFSIAVHTLLEKPTTVFSLACTNISKRPIKLTSFGLLMPNGMQVLISWRPESTCKIPMMLKDGENCILFLDSKGIINTLRDEGYTKVVKIHPFFGDSSGRRYFAKKFKINLEEWE
jgi:hypothetical protein